METTGLRISVLITTRNRAQKLHRLLRSIANQTHVPNEVIVVDNASSDNTSDICIKMNTALNIKYIHETRVGIPYGRNTGISQATGDIFAFIDDDCEADAQWTSTILEHFCTHKSSDAAIGFTTAFETSVSSDIEQAYYERWLTQNVRNIYEDAIIQSGNMMDFKNCAIRSSIMRSVKFSTTTQFGDVGDEDVEIGKRLQKICRNIWFIPTMKVKHHNSITVGKALYRNYWNGFSNQMLLKEHIDISAVPIQISRFRFGIHCIKEQFSNRTMAQAILFLILYPVYPMASKLGRITATTCNLLGLKIKIPKRK